MDLYVVTLCFALLGILLLFLWKYIVNKRKIKGQFWISENDGSRDTGWALTETNKEKFTADNNTKNFRANARRFAPISTTLQASDSYIFNRDGDDSASIRWKSFEIAGDMSKSGDMTFQNDSVKIFGKMPNTYRGVRSSFIHNN